MVARDDARIAFEDFCYRETLTRMGSRFRDPDFWRALNPTLSISTFPFQRPVAPRAIPEDAAARAAADLLDDGYFMTPPVMPAEEMTAFCAAVERVSQAGYPTVFACVYDEFWRLFAGLEPLMQPLLGDYNFVPDGVWSFYVPPSHSGRGRWAAAGPHRDSLGPDPEVLARRVPSLINLWIPLTDATPENSCIYVVPAPHDPGFYEPGRAAGLDRIALQDVRAVPARAGSILGWSTHLLHWGGRSSAFARTARVSVALYLQRRDAAPFSADQIDPGGEVRFEQRLKWIAGAIALPEIFS